MVPYDSTNIHKSFDSLLLFLKSFIDLLQQFSHNMLSKLKTIRPFIGAFDFEESSRFYIDLGFDEKELLPDLSLFTSQEISFYLQKAYVKDWVDNTMIFVEVADVVQLHEEVVNKNLTQNYPTVRVSSIRKENWGREFFVHDPSGILWHFGQFS